MKVILINLKNVINSNYVFMSIVSLIFGLLALWKSNKEVFLHYTYADIVLKGYVFLFIIFSVELSKDLMQKEKLTKKTEWFLANGVTLHFMYMSHACTLFLAAALMLLPLLITSSIIMGKVNIEGLIIFYIYGFLYSIIININILIIKDMNRFKSLGLKITCIHMLATLVEILITIYSKDILLGFGGGFLFCLIVIIISNLFISKERVISSFY